MFVRARDRYNRYRASRAAKVSDPSAMPCLLNRDAGSRRELGAAQRFLIHRLRRLHSAAELQPRRISRKGAKTQRSKEELGLLGFFAFLRLCVRFLRMARRF